MNFFANLVRNRQNQSTANPSRPSAAPTAAAVVAPPAAAAAAAPDAAPMPANPQLIVGHSNYSAGKIFKGLLVDKAEDGSVKLDPRYEQVCYLLKLMAEGGQPAPVAPNQSEGMPSLSEGTTMIPLEVTSREAYDALFATLLEGSKDNWAALYSGVLESMGGRGDLIAGALAAEQRMTLEGVDRCVRDTGLQVFMVPAIATATIEQPSSGTHGEALASDNADGADQQPNTNDLIQNARVTSVRLASAPVNADTQAQEGTTTDVGAALSHDGPISATIAGVLRVRAATAEVAEEVAGQILRMHAVGAFPYKLPFDGTTITAVELSPRQAEFEDSGYGYSYDR